MDEKCYFISEASKLVGVETHVLRYWEEQLDLTIRRNEMGHRYYIEEDIQLLQSIRQIMEKGIQLRAVKMMLPSLMEHREDLLLEMIGGGNSRQENTVYPNNEGGRDEMGETGMSQQEVLEQKQAREVRISQFQEIMSDLIGQALRENSSELAAAASDQVAERVIKEMDYLMRMRESQEEEHFKKLDETIRGMQKTGRKRIFKREKRKDCK